MNVLLLGNGFDLYYKLPTKYANFLHVASYLTSCQIQNHQHIGEILAQKAIHAEDSFVERCYLAHKSTYDNTLIDANKIGELINLVQHNKWFSYLKKAFNKDVGWIDFEKEIAYVVNCFMKILPESGKTFSYKKHRYGKYIVDSFDFLVDQHATDNTVTIGTIVVKNDFCIERPLGSGNYHVSKEKVAQFLSEDLQKLARALDLYLDCFVDSICPTLRNQNTCERIPIFKHIEKAITFNYTHAYESIYITENTFHVHGSTGENIVLGINPDTSDEIATVDTSFILFKKYFQRTLYETDFDYLRWISTIKQAKQSYRLLVMGHSLDVTDKDILLDLFHSAKEIIILYHDSAAKASYIANLVKLYGKDGFDSLRRDQVLTFLPLGSDFTALAQQYTDEAFANLIDVIEPQIII